MIRAIWFDCFGVIITDALEALMKKLDIERPGVSEEIMDIIHANNLGLLQPAESNDQIAKILGVTVPEYRQMIDGSEVKDHEVLDWICELRAIYKTGLLSNIGRASIDKRFSEQELKAYFDAVVISGDIGMAKPDTAIYDYAAHQLQVQPEECVFIDDREGHCRGAESAGMHAIQFKSFTQAKTDLEKLLEK